MKKRDFLVLEIILGVILGIYLLNNFFVPIYSPDTREDIELQAFTKGILSSDYETDILSDIAYWVKFTEEDVKKLTLEINGLEIKMLSPTYFKDTKNGRNLLSTGISYVPRRFENGENIISLKIEFDDGKMLEKEDTIYFDNKKELNGRSFNEDYNDFIIKATESQVLEPIDIGFISEKQEDFPLEACVYSTRVVSLGIYNGSIPGDRERVRDTAIENGLRVIHFYEDSIQGFNSELASYGYSNLLDNIEGMYKLYNVENLPPEIVNTILPIYYRYETINASSGEINITNTYPYSQGIKIDFVGNMQILVQLGIAGFNNPSELETIVVADNLNRYGPTGDMPNELYSEIGGFTAVRPAIGGGMIFIPSQQEGVTYYRFFWGPAHQALMHEMGHSIKLGHVPGSGENLMNPGCNIFMTCPTNLKHNQAFAFIGSLCGQSVGEPITLQDQSGRFGVNIFAESDQSSLHETYFCGDGAVGVSVGGDEWGENGYYAAKEVCVSPDTRPLPVWNPYIYDWILNSETCQCEPPPPPEGNGTKTKDYNFKNARTGSGSGGTSCGGASPPSCSATEDCPRVILHDYNFDTGEYREIEIIQECKTRTNSQGELECACQEV